MKKIINVCASNSFSSSQAASISSSTRCLHHKSPQLLLQKTTKTSSSPTPEYTSLLPPRSLKIELLSQCKPSAGSTTKALTSRLFLRTAR